MSTEDMMKALEACTATSDYWLHNHSNKCIISPLNCTDWSEDTYIKLMEENNMNNKDMDVKITINLIEEETEEETVYDNDMDMKLSTVVQEKHWEELEGLARISSYIKGRTDGEYDQELYDILLELILRRLKEVCEVHNTTDGLTQYINDSDECMKIARYNIISSLTIRRYSSNEKINEYFKSNLEKICDKILKGDAKKAEVGLFLVA